MSIRFAHYGDMPADLVELTEDSVPCGPMVPGAVQLADMATESLAGIAVHAPPATVERRAVLARALVTLAPGAPLTAFAGKTKGGQRLAAELEAFGCTVIVSHKRHHQIVTTARPTAPFAPAASEAIDAALTDGAPRLVPDLGVWSQPGLFSWDRLDPGTALLIANLPALEGRGADLGCGIGLIARAVLGSQQCTKVTLVDLDARAIAMARRNLALGAGAIERAAFLWTDVRTAQNLPGELDFVVMNPPFHDGGAEDKALGQAFIARAAQMLRPGGALWLTANRHLPYEAELARGFDPVTVVALAGGYKILTGVRRAAPARKARPVRERPESWRLDIPQDDTAEAATPRAGSPRAKKPRARTPRATPGRPARARPRG